MTTTVESVITRMEEATGRLLDSLRPGQRETIMLPLEPEAVSEWSYTPLRHDGLLLFEMDAEQRQNVRRLLASCLSEGGYNRAMTVMGIEGVLDRMDKFPERRLALTIDGDGAMEDSRRRDPLNFTVAVFNAPGDRDGWGWRISGHHVSVHFTVRDGRVSATPIFFGASPGYVRMPGNSIMRPLAVEEDTARELLRRLSPDQVRRAVIAPKPPLDVVQSNRRWIQDGVVPLPETFGIGPTAQLRQELGITDELDDMLRYTAEPKGLPFSDLNAEQKDAFKAILSAYFDRVDSAIADQAASSLLRPESLNSMSIAWAGAADGQPQLTGSDPRSPFYYRIQGDNLLIEFDNAQADGNHMHSVWRDPVGDFGGDILAEHYAKGHA
jgi:hypothetical protein